MGKTSEKKWRRTGNMIKHHDKARSRHGGKSKQNLVRMDEAREKAYHFLFGNRTLRESANLLIRIADMKAGS